MAARRKMIHLLFSIYRNEKRLLFFLAGGIVVLFLKPVTEIEEKFKPTLLNCIITVTLLTVSVFFFVKYSPFIYFNF